MHTHDQAVRGRHSPALWGLLAACAGELLLVVGWNVAQHYRDTGVRLGTGLRSALRL